MTEPESFLLRWTRLKREAQESREAEAPREPAAREDSDAASVPADADADAARAPTIRAEPTVDLSALPAIESITAATDIRPFLARGVPAELTRAALRRVWVVDPKIRDFIGIAENQWDFTADNAMPGFGPLGPLDDVRRLVAQVMGEKTEEADVPPAAASAEIPHGVGNSATSAADEGGEAGAPQVVDAASEAPIFGSEAAPPADTPDRPVDIALQQDVTSPAPARRSHGGALPK